MNNKNNLEECNRKTEKSTKLAIESCNKKYGAPPILIYQSLNTILDAHPDWNNAKKALKEYHKELEDYFQSIKKN